MANQNRKKKFNPGALIVVAVLLLLTEPELFGTLLGIAIILAIFASPFLVIYFVLRKRNGRSEGSRTPARREPAFDDCPKTFCFHRDRGEHHVRKGKEIDPWDRPDIDISKYQRRQ